MQCVCSGPIGAGNWAHLLSIACILRKPLRGVLEGTSHLHQRFRRLGSLLRRKAAEQAVDFPHAVHATVPAALASDSTSEDSFRTFPP